MTEWPRWMSHTTVCRYVDAGKRRLRTMMQNGFPKGNLIGGKMHWDRVEIDAYMSGHSAKVVEVDLLEQIRQSARRHANGG